MWTSACGHSSTHVDEYAGREIDFTVTVCDDTHEQCPFFPADRRLFTCCSTIRRGWHNTTIVRKKRQVTTGACVTRFENFENLYSDCPEIWRMIIAAESAAHDCGQGVSLRRYLPLEKSEKKWGTNGWATSSRELSSSRLVWAA